MIRKIVIAIAKPSLFFFSGMLIGIVLGLFLIQPEIGEKVVDLQRIGARNFASIAATNCVSILIVYISVAISRKYAYVIYSINGLLLGVVLGWIIDNNILLLVLIVPHGVFEIFDVLATGYIVNKGECFIRTRFKEYVFALFANEMLTIICAAIEAFITPYFARFIY